MCVYAHLSADFISAVYHQLSQYSSKSWSAQPKAVCDRNCEAFQANSVLCNDTFSFIGFKMAYFQFHSKLPCSSTTELNRSAILVSCVT